MAVFPFYACVAALNVPAAVVAASAADAEAFVASFSPALQLSSPAYPDESSDATGGMYGRTYIGTKLRVGIEPPTLR